MAGWFWAWAFGSSISLSIVWDRSRRSMKERLQLLVRLKGLNRGKTIYDGDSGGWGEDEVRVLHRYIFLHAGEGELRDGSIDLFELHGENKSCGINAKGEGFDALAHAFGDAGDLIAAADRLDGDLVEFFFQLGVAEEEAKRGAEVVELFGGDALCLGVSGGVEPAAFPVQNEYFTGWGVVAPAHTAGLFEQQGSGFGAVHAHAGVALGVVGLEGRKVVVVVVDALQQRVVALRDEGGT
jgi:hypothetical protein